jgi:prepilin-type N-terminal cleavage/methylation domain-containing protein
MTKRSLWNVIKAQSGFTLPEVMVGGAILAGVALAGATLFKNQMDAQRRMNADQQLAVYHANLTKTLENVHHCNATFQTFNLASATSIGPTDPINEVKLCESNCNLDSDASSVVPAATPFITPGQQIGTGGPASAQQLNHWYLKSITPVDTITGTGSLRLRVSYIDGTNKNGGREVKKDIIVNLRFSEAGRFVECFNNQESAVNNLSNDLCDTINSTGVSSDGRLVYWDEAEQKCKLNTNVKNCTAQGIKWYCRLQKHLYRL